MQPPPRTPAASGVRPQCHECSLRRLNSLLRSHGDRDTWVGDDLRDPQARQWRQGDYEGLDGHPARARRGEGVRQKVLEHQGSVSSPAQPCAARALRALHLLTPVLLNRQQWPAGIHMPVWRRAGYHRLGPGVPRDDRWRGAQAHHPWERGLRCAGLPCLGHPAECHVGVHARMLGDQVGRGHGRGRPAQARGQEGQERGTGLQAQARRWRQKVNRGFCPLDIYGGSASVCLARTSHGTKPPTPTRHSLSRSDGYHNRQSEQNQVWT